MSLMHKTERSPAPSCLTVGVRATARGLALLLPLALPALVHAAEPPAATAKPAAAKPVNAKPAVAKPTAKTAGKAAEAPPAEVPAVILIESSRPGAAVFIDGKAIGKTPIESAVKLKPGRHELVLQAAPTDPSSGARQVIEVKAGERRVIDLSPKLAARFIEPPQENPPPPAVEPAQMPPPPTVAAAPPPAREVASESTPIYKKWWFWTGVGAGAVLVIGLAAGLGTRGGGDNSMLPSSPTWPGGSIDGRASALLRINLSLGGRP